MTDQEKIKAIREAVPEDFAVMAECPGIYRTSWKEGKNNMHVCMVAIYEGRPIVTLAIMAGGISDEAAIKDAIVRLQEHGQKENSEPAAN